MRRTSNSRTYGLLERAQPDMLLLLPLHRVVQQHPRLEDMQFPLGEKADFRQKRAPRVLERVREQESEDKTTRHRKGAHERKQPEPTGFTTDAPHVKDSVGEEFGRSLTGLVTEVEDLRIRAGGIRKRSVGRVRNLNAGSLHTIVRLAVSSLVYQVDKVHRPPGMKPVARGNEVSSP
jgi:hypothetical protein